VRERIWNRSGAMRGCGVRACIWPVVLWAGTTGQFCWAFFFSEVISPQVIELTLDVQFGAKTLKIRICSHPTCARRFFFFLTSTARRVFFFAEATLLCI
jgi:hypothetical protein